MAHYYYPLSARDFAFENIFSSESVSPPSFYPRRSFGFDYFPILPGVGNENAIILFSQPPVYEDGEFSKFILKIDDVALNPDHLLFIAEGIFAYTETLYFEKEYINILFFTNKDVRVAILKANTSLPTKTTEKYAASFKIINEDSCKSFDTHISHLIQSDSEITLKVSLDKKYNHLKGFIYGLVIGQIANDRKREFAMKLHFQEITNAFAELKSRLDDAVFTKAKSESSKLVQPYIEKLFFTISIAKSEYDEITMDDVIDNDLLIDYILNTSSRLKSIADVNLYLDYIITSDELLERSEYKMIVDRYQRYRNKSTDVFSELQHLVEQFIRVFRSADNGRHFVEELNNRIKILLRNATEQFLGKLSDKTYNLSTNLSGISYDFTSNEVTINSGQAYLNTRQDNEFTSIINGILKFAKSKKGPAQKDMILRIVEEIGSGYTKKGRDTLLYQYLDNRIDVYSLDNAANLVMKNFVAFVFNPDSMEKLDDFLINKNVEERWMAFSFWGAYNGFANISRNYTRDIFNSSNVKLQVYIDGYLRQYTQAIANSSFKEILTVSRVSKENTAEEVNASGSKDEWVEKLYNVHIAPHYKLNYKEFLESLQLTKQKIFQDTLKSKNNIAKRDSLKLFNIIKKYFDPNALFHE